MIDGLAVLDRERLKMGFMPGNARKKSDLDALDALLAALPKSEPTNEEKAKQKAQGVKAVRHKHSRKKRR